MAIITKQVLKTASPDDVKRLAKWLKLRDTDEMSDRQLIKLLTWLFKRPALRMRNLITW